MKQQIVKKKKCMNSQKIVTLKPLPNCIDIKLQHRRDCIYLNYM